MKENAGTRLYGWFYSHACKRQMEKQYGCQTVNAAKKEYRVIIRRAKDIGPSRLLSAYCMAAWFIALNRSTGSNPEENYAMFCDGLQKNRLFAMALGGADAYLDEKKLPGRLQWAAESKKKKYENDWVVDVLPGGEAFDLGYDYLECGACKLCRDEGCFELAKYLCRLDFVLADLMNMELARTTTIAEGGERCDFRYRRKRLRWKEESS